MRILFMGTPDFAVPTLQRLIDDGHEIVGVFTQPDRPKGRGYKLAPPPVKELALAHELPVYQPTKMRDGTVLSLFRELAPELAVVVAYGRILPRDLLEVPTYGCINVHGSLLPKYRGAAPIQWSVLNGEEYAGVTTMFMAEELDAGDMLLQAATPIGENETSGELYERLAVLGASLLHDTVEALQAGTLQPQPQDAAQATYAPMLDRSLSKLDFSLPARQLHHTVCGLSPWPVASTVLDGKVLKVHRSVCLPDRSGKPGTVLEGGKRLIVACGEGALELTEVQLEGSKRLPAADFLRGHPLPEGMQLGE